MDHGRGIAVNRTGQRISVGVGSRPQPNAFSTAPALSSAPTKPPPQAIPYGFTLWYVPMHLLTFELLLFATGVWTTNIHDNIHGKTDPIMGAKYHTIHHTTYHHNYGHYFTFVDRMFGTLLTPEELEEKERRRALSTQDEPRGECGGEASGT